MTNPLTETDALARIAGLTDLDEFWSGPMGDAQTRAALTAAGPALFHLPGRHDQRTHGHGKGKYLEGGDLLSHHGVFNLERKMTTFRKRHEDSRSPHAAVLARMQKFDGKPNIVPSEELDAAIAAGTVVPMFRGVQTDAAGSGAQHAEAFRRGPAFYGRGGFGSGMYFGSDEQHASDGTMIRAGLRADARVISYDDLDQLYRDETEGEHRDPRLARSVFFEDPGLYALSLGYDAIAVPDLQTGETVGWNVLNRTAVWVEESPAEES